MIGGGPLCLPPLSPESLRLGTISQLEPLNENFPGNLQGCDLEWKSEEI